MMFTPQQQAIASRVFPALTLKLEAVLLQSAIAIEFPGVAVGKIKQQALISLAAIAIQERR